jgi:hypothetical protein
MCLRLRAAVLIAQRGRELIVPVSIDQLPPLAPSPESPRRGVWLMLLLLFVLVGVALMFLLDSKRLQRDAFSFWAMAVGAPLLAWSAASFVRAAIFIGQQRAAHGWNQAREADLVGLIRLGRRFQHVLSVSLHTALRKPDEHPAAQLNGLLEGTQALKLQSSRPHGAMALHSRKPGEINEPLERVLLRSMALILADLREPLAQLSGDTPLALLQEIDTCLPEKQIRQIWQRAWEESGIRQSFQPIDGSGLSAVDQWLDQRVSDNALLLVVALQCASRQPEGTAEAAVGILLGIPLTQTTLPPIACLHCPEQARARTAEALCDAVKQAMEWVPLTAQSIEQVWQAGIAPSLDASLTTVLINLSMPSKPNQGLCNLDALLGVAGCASPWLAIAAATQNIQCGIGPQFIFSGDSSSEAGLWSSVLMPVSPSSK